MPFPESLIYITNKNCYNSVFPSETKEKEIKTKLNYIFIPEELHIGKDVEGKAQGGVFGFFGILHITLCIITWNKSTLVENYLKLMDHIRVLWQTAIKQIDYVCL